MNGGVLHAVEAVAEKELAAACAGFRFFGFERIAALLEDVAPRVAQAGDEEEESSNEGYWRDLPDDAPLVERFRGHFATHPERYAPLD